MLQQCVKTTSKSKVTELWEHSGLDWKALGLLDNDIEEYIEREVSVINILSNSQVIFLH